MLSSYEFVSIFFERTFIPLAKATLCNITSFFLMPPEKDVLHLIAMIYKIGKLISRSNFQCSSYARCIVALNSLLHVPMMSFPATLFHYVFAGPFP